MVKASQCGGAEKRRARACRDRRCPDVGATSHVSGSGPPAARRAARARRADRGTVADRSFAAPETQCQTPKKCLTRGVALRPYESFVSAGSVSAGSESVSALSVVSAGSVSARSVLLVPAGLPAGAGQLPCASGVPSPSFRCAFSAWRETAILTQRPECPARWQIVTFPAGEPPAVVGSPGLPCPFPATAYEAPKPAALQLSE